MKIELTDRLWNHEKGEKIEVSDERGEWAIWRGKAIEVKAAKTKRKKKIDKEAEARQDKSE